MIAIILKNEEEFKKVIEHFRTDISSLRTGRANPALVENIQIKAYGSMMEIKGLASITIPDPKTIVIDPWDKSILKDVEKGITEANIGINPVVDGTIVRLSMPLMTEENRKEMVKILKQKSEQSRVSLRGIREKVKNAIIQAEEAKEISEDERFRAQEDLDKYVGGFNSEIDKMTEEKEKEIMTI
ncbi:MAG: ribosome recycling factor [Patescibacteria group bacterium]|nr:ribosome recycling factor [Patescibacteria group bacterium]